ncbi:Eco57I restriction-modification methylase domain-containing protein [Streptomyces sp. NBC_00667]|uniref:Eco57I restriction-modification methylase domain-containing protein n=1 Tax=Streptomyces sp. NBC_00667 TaxID=2975803 RepID=UPI003FA6EFA7
MQQVSADKLRGGFYSPQALVAVCLDRLRDLLPDSLDSLRLLEPSAGDGAFIRGLDADPLGKRVRDLVAVELLETEARRCEEAGGRAPFETDIRHGSFLDPDLVPEEGFDAAVGNPPFVRFQFVSDTERSYADQVATGMGVTLKGVSNLWIPIFLCALNKVREGGAFAFIIPAECLTGISAGAVRRWLLRNCSSVRVDLFGPGSFPGVLQEVVVLSGRREPSAADARLTVWDHSAAGRAWHHSASPDAPTWTRYLLSPAQLEALDEVSSLSCVRSAGSWVRFGVATVTGANDYFSVDRETIEQYGLEGWILPLLPRIRNAEGLVFTPEDHERNVDEGARAGLIDFSRGESSPLGHDGALRYIHAGEQAELHTRYKCRIREPWYCVPVVAAGDLLLSKRSHLYPRVVVNEVSAITTDTIYQGKMLAPEAMPARSFAASFHNSLTLLSAEIEGRSFGGGVLELVPSEVARLRVMAHPSMSEELDRLDRISRSASGDVEEVLIRETDGQLAKRIPEISDSTLGLLAEARTELQKRRLDRNRSSVPL